MTGGMMAAAGSAAAMKRAILVGGGPGKNAGTVDGVTWIANTALSGTLMSVARNATNTLLLATSSSSPYVYKSTDGVTWATASGGSWGGGLTPGGVWWSDDLNSFIVQATISGESFYHIVSADATSWNDENIGHVVAVTGYVNASSIDVHLFTTTGGAILASITGLNASWSEVKSQTGTALRAVAWSSTIPMFVAVGASNTLFSSPTGTTWTARTSNVGSTVTINDVAWSPSLGIFVACADGGYTCYSSNGTTWTTGIRPTTSNMLAVIWDATLSRFVMVGDSGEVWTSSDGTTTWTQRTSGFSSTSITDVG